MRDIANPMHPFGRIPQTQEWRVKMVHPKEVRDATGSQSIAWEARQ